MSDVLQCPYCVLRFSTQSELDQHKAFDHPSVAEEEIAGDQDAPAVTEGSEQAPEPEPERKGGWFKRLLGGG